jgi:hypothetical protein
MNQFQIGLTTGLYDPFKAARSRLIGNRRFGYFYGSHRDVGVDRPGPHRIDGTDLLTLNSLNVDLRPLHVPKNYFRQKARHDVQSFDVLLNLVTNPDTNDVILKNIERILAGFKGRVINPPSKVLQTRRDMVARKLSGLDWLDVPECLYFKVTTPKAVNEAIERAGIRFPAILRQAGTHLGRCELVHGLSDIVVPKGQAFYLTSYRNYASPDGLYRKVRFWFIGDKIVFRHLVVSDNWNVHFDASDRVMKLRPDLAAEERSLFQAHSGNLPPGLQNRLNTIRERVGLDFFGLDCNFLDDERLLFFEANAAMNFDKQSCDDQWRGYSAQCVPLAAEGFKSLLRPKDAT